MGSVLSLVTSYEAENTANSPPKFKYNFTLFYSLTLGTNLTTAGTGVFSISIILAFMLHQP